MQNVGKRKSRPRRTYTPQFKADIVEQCQRGDRGINQVARDFNLTESAVRKWVKQAEIDAGARDGTTTTERDEMTRLRAENRQLKEDVDILRRATAFFAKETR
jgi:transposase